MQNGFEEKPDEEIDDVETDIQKEIEEFFRLDPVPIDDLQINSFLQECDLAKTKYFQPKTLDDIIQGNFEKKVLFLTAAWLILLVKLIIYLHICNLV